MNEVAVQTAINGIIPIDQGVPDHFKDYDGPTGTEGLTNEDMTIPRIEVGQGLTGAVKDGDVADGDIFLNVSRQTLAEKGEPLVVVPLVMYKEYVLWRDQADDGGGLLARASAVQTDEGVRYAWDKPNETFKNKIGGKLAVEWETGVYVDDEDHNLKRWGSSIAGDPDSAPAATETYVYILSLPEHGNLVASLSLSSTKLKRAKDFNSIIDLNKSVPMWGKAFIMHSEDDSRKSGEFNNVRFKMYGHLDDVSTARNKVLVDRFVGYNVVAEQAPQASGSDDL